MQGRLTPPVNGRLQAFPAQAWRDEFVLAHAVGLTAIEWIVESPLETNPIWTDEGVAQIQECIASHGVRIDHVCADYFMEAPLVRAAGSDLEWRRSALAWIILRAAAIGAVGVDVPFVDASAIHTFEEQDDVCRALAPCLAIAHEAGIRIGLETSLPPARMAALLKTLDHPAAVATYDTGNSAALGFDPNEEMDAYGDAIGHVHVKDRMRGGGSVPLGAGDADFPRVFRLLDTCGYRGGFTLQTARGADEIVTVDASIERLRAWMSAS
jgi:hexulose-6-phosphate isomerase